MISLALGDVEPGYTTFPQVFGREAPLDPIPAAVAGGFLLVYALFYIALPAVLRRGGKPIPPLNPALAVVLNLLFVAAFFGAIEHTLSLAQRRDAERWHNSYLMPHPLRLWALTPGAREGTESFSLRINRDGMRGDDVPRERMPGELRILVLGDSCTMGFGVDEELTFCRLLEKRMRAREPGRVIRVINGGVIGYSARQCYLLAQEALARTQADLLVVDYMRNYHSEALMKELSPQSGNRLIESARAVLYRSRLFLYLRRVLMWGRIRRVVKAGAGEFPVDYYRENLARIAALAKQARIPVLFVDLRRDRENEIFCDAARQAQAPLAAVTLDHDKYYLPGDPEHPNAAGHAVICDGLFRELIARRLIEPRP